MKVWIDAQLSPALAPWLKNTFAVNASSVRRLNFQEASDRDIFLAAREAKAVVMTKDYDFVELLDQFGPPPQIIWIRCGNTSNAQMREFLMRGFPKALSLLQEGEPLVEITDIS